MSMNNESNIIAWFNKDILASCPISLSLLHTAIVQSVLGKDHSILSTHSSMKLRERGQSVKSTRVVTVSSLVCPIADTVSFITTFFVMFYIKERVSKAKHLQLISGLNVTTFWLASFLFDFIVYILVITTPIIILIYQKDSSCSINGVMALIVLLISFGIAVLPALFVVSFLFTDPATGLVCTFILSRFPGK